MAEKPKIPGVQGWEQFLTMKFELLDAFDRARVHARSHEVGTYHGEVGEAQFRQWLSTFLPKRYGVTSGYIVSQRQNSDVKLPHFDVIIYDQLESPVLWIEGHPDASDAGKSRAIPAEYVGGVIEVKATLNSTSAKKVIEHLHDLDPLLKDVDDEDERYKQYLPENFFSAAVFYDVLKKDEHSEAAINNLVPAKALRGYYGGLILRGEGLDRTMSSRLRYPPKDYPGLASHPIGTSLLDIDKASFGRNPSNDTHVLVRMGWSASFFAWFAFDLIALLKGTYDTTRVSSGHAWGPSEH